MMKFKFMVVELEIDIISANLETALIEFHHKTKHKYRGQMDHVLTEISQR